MKKSAIVLFFSALLTVTAFAQSVQDGVSHLYAERLASAKATFEKMIASNPNNIEAVYWLGQTHIADNDVAAAKALYEKTLAANGNAPLVMVGMGHVELLQNKTAEARQRFEAALSASRGRKGDDPTILNAVGRANALAKAGDAAYAITKLNAAVQAQPNNADIYLNLGNAYRKQLNGGQAVFNYTKAAQLNPKLAIAHYRIARIYETQRNWDVYTLHLNNAIQADPKFAPAYEGLYYYTLLYPKDFAKAQEYANQYLANTDPKIENEYINAQTDYVRKNYDAAIATAKKILSQVGDKVNPRVYRLLSYAHLEKGDTANARIYVDQLFAKADEDFIIGNDLTLKADVYAKEDPSIIVPLYIQAARMDSVYANQVRFLQEGINKFEQKGQKQYVGELKLAMYQIDPTPNPAELISLGIPFYQAGNYKKADSLFSAYSVAFKDSIYGHLWSARALAKIDTNMTQGLAIPAYTELLRVATADKERFKNYGLEAAAQLATYYNNVKGDKATAITYLQRALEFDPSNAAIQRNLQILQKSPAQPKSSSTAPAKSPASTKAAASAKK